MNTEAYKNFLLNCKKVISDKKAINCKEDEDYSVLFEIFRNKEYVKKIAFNIRNKFINAITDNLMIFDNNFSANGGIIDWCIDYNDFLTKVDKVLLKHKVKNINLFASYFTQEIGIDKFIKNKDYNYDSETTDCVIFNPQFGIVNTGSLFLNFDSAYNMELVLNSKIKIFVLSICDFVFKLEDVEIFSHLYSIYKNKVNFPYLTSIYTPSPTKERNDVYLFLIDNGRSNVLENKDIRSALTCINCDACKNVCPIFNIIGEEPYNNVFSGPLANVILPFMENVENYKHLCFSCTLCGNCSAICPVKIPVCEMIVSNRKYFFENKFMDMKDERLTKVITKFVSSRKKMNTKKWLKNFRLKNLVNSKVMEEYKFEVSTFNKQFIEKKYGK